jgi:hypothetical protein
MLPQRATRRWATSTAKRIRRGGAGCIHVSALSPERTRHALASRSTTDLARAVSAPSPWHIVNLSRYRAPRRRRCSSSLACVHSSTQPRLYLTLSVSSAPTPAGASMASGLSLLLRCECSVQSFELNRATTFVDRAADRFRSLCRRGKLRGVRCGMCACVCARARALPPPPPPPPPPPLLLLLLLGQPGETPAHDVPARFRLYECASHLPPRVDESLGLFKPAIASEVAARMKRRAHNGMTNGMTNPCQVRYVWVNPIRKTEHMATSQTAFGLCQVCDRLHSERIGAIVDHSTEEVRCPDASQSTSNAIVHGPHCSAPTLPTASAPAPAHG